MRKSLLFAAAALSFNLNNNEVELKRFKYELRITGDRFSDPGRVYYTDTIQTIGKRSFWTGSDGINYGLLTKQITKHETIY